MKEKGIKILISIFLFASFLMPFSVFAESVGGSSPIIGVNITYVGYDGEVVPYQTTVRFDTEQTMWRCTSSHSTMGCQVWESITSSGSDLDEITGTITTNATSTYTYRLYQYEFIFDKSYVGSITFNGNHPGATTTTTYYVNGDRLVLTDVNLVTSFTIGSYNLVYAPLETIETLRQYNFPIESLSAITTMARNNLSKIHDLFTMSSWTYPVFQFNQNDQIMTFWSNNNQKFIIILYANQNMRRSVINNYISFDYGTFTASDISSSFYYNNSASRFIKIEYTNNSGSGHDIHLSYINSLVIDMVPIFISDYNSENTYNVSSDFALNFGLSNQLLNDLHVVAQGTQQSNSAASDLESANSNMASDMNSMATIENGYSQDFNSQLQNIDFTNPIQQNQGILPAANFVISIFNGLISNNPFTVLIIIVCILLIGKKVIGK